MAEFYAHTRQDLPKNTWDPLLEHLEKTAAQCQIFARAFAPEAGRFVGLWHDLGKFRPEFQNYLLANCEEGHRDASRKCEHSVVGAYRAYLQDRIDLAMIIAAHHGRRGAWIETSDISPRSLFPESSRGADRTRKLAARPHIPVSPFFRWKC